MNFEPQKFFIGLIDFFSVLLPGAVLMYVINDSASSSVFSDEFISLEAPEAWAVFFFASYLVGHFLFLIGSWLDDLIYDPIRIRATDRAQITRLLNGWPLSPRILRWLAWLCFKKGPDRALARVVPIKESYLKRIGDSDAINTFQWCKARLAINHPGALATVNRFEADSKFFRSFILVLLLLFPLKLYQGQWWFAAGLVFVILPVTFWRYMEQRFKSTQQAYWFILTLEADKQQPVPGAEQSNLSDSRQEQIGLTHAGGVVFRKQGGKLEYLLVQAKDEPDQWVLPKGHIEPGENPRHCAIREVKEETGVWAHITHELTVSEYSMADQHVKVQFYLMEAVEDGKPVEEWRKHAWHPLAAAVDRATHPENKDLLRLAGQSTVTLAGGAAARLHVGKEGS